MSINLNTIPRKNGKNPAGRRKAYIVACEDVSSIPSASSSFEITENIVMKAGKKWVEAELEPEVDGSLNVEEPDSEGGTGYVYNPDFFVSGNTPAQRAALDKLNGIQCLILLQDKEGYYDLAGELDRGIKLRVNYEDGKKAGSRRGFAIRGSMDYSHLPYRYLGTITIA